METIGEFMQTIAIEGTMTYEEAKTAAINILVQREEVACREREALENGNAYRSFWDMVQFAWTTPTGVS
jgi:hypothetical protein